MAAKKKSKAKPAKTKAKPQAKPAKKSAKKAKAKAKAKPAPKAVKGKPAAAKAAKAKPAPKPAKAKPAAAKAAKPKPAPKPAKAKPSKAEAPKLVQTVKRAAKKVVQVAAQTVMSFMDSDAGKPAPSFELSDEKGESVSSSALAGKPYLLYFYPKDDTPGCTKEACDIRDNFGRFGQQGLRVLGVSPDSSKSHAKFGQKYGLPFTLLSDPEKTLANAYGVWAKKQNYGKEYMGIVRSSFLVGSDGLIKKAYRGVRVDGHVDAVLQDAAALL